VTAATTAVPTSAAATSAAAIVSTPAPTAAQPTGNIAVIGVKKLEKKNKNK